jgi:hypothetical protein
MNETKKPLFSDAELAMTILALRREFTRNPPPNARELVVIGTALNKLETIWNGGWN